jgi:hypothetical protein
VIIYVSFKTIVYWIHLVQPDFIRLTNKTHIWHVIFYCRDKIRDKYQDFYTAFRKYDTKKKGSLSVNEIQRVLNDLNFFMNDEEFFRLMDS